MIINFYTLRALVESWNADGQGREIGDIYSQNKDELVLALAGGDTEWMFHLSVDPSFQYMFRSAGYTKANANAVTLFEQVLGQTLERVRIARRDRMVYFELSGGFSLQAQLFGSRANIFLVKDETVVDAFKRAEKWQGQEPPAPRAAADVSTWEAFEERWQENRKTVSQALSYTILLFDRTLGREVMHRAGVSEKDPETCTKSERRALFEASQEVTEQLINPQPVIYWKGKKPDLFSLLPLAHRQEQTSELFEDLNKAVRFFVRTSLAHRAFHAIYDPMHKALTQEKDRLTRSLEHMTEELSKGSRAERHERWGHLLMAAASRMETGAEEVTLQDLFADESKEVTIALNPALSAVENAQEYYEKARRVKRSRKEAEARWEETEQRLARYTKILEELEQVEGFREVKQFKRDKSNLLADLLGETGREGERIPFRQFTVAGDYSVWAGKNAKQNDLLLSRYARKYDFWMHARNVPGSHVLLRRKDRNKEPDQRAVRAAAAIAAYYSQARGSALVPVQVTERKYVHKPKGAVPGHVRVDREEVVMVEPGLPD